MSHSRGGSEEETRLLDLDQRLDSRGQQPAPGKTLIQPGFLSYQDNTQVTGNPVKVSVYLVEDPAGSGSSQERVAGPCFFLLLNCHRKYMK